MRLTIKFKLGLAFGLVTTLLVAASALGVSSLGGLNTRLDAMLDGPVKRLDNAEILRGDFIQLIRTEKNLLLVSDADKMHGFENDILEQRKTFESVLSMSEAISSEAGKARWATLRQTWEGFKALDEKLRALVDNGHRADAVALSMGAARAVTKAVDTEVGDIVALQQHQLDEGRSGAAASYAQTRTLLLVIAAACALLSIALAAWISLQISAGLRKVGSLANAVALGDLEQAALVTTDDEIKDLIDTVNRMIASLRATAAVAISVSQGDLSVQPKPLSDKDMSLCFAPNFVATSICSRTRRESVPRCLPVSSRYGTGGTSMWMSCCTY